MSHWVEFQFEERIRTILQNVRYYKPDHHLCRPFLSVYQIAIAFDRSYPAVRQTMGLQIGGSGIDEHNSFSQYIALELSRNLGNGTITDFEGGFISNDNLAEISFNHNNEIIRSSLTDTVFDLSIYRYNPSNNER